VHKPGEILSVINHRPWELPSGSWIMMQGWYNLLFAHWPIAPNVLRPLIPAPLTIDTFQGSAWLGITPFDLHLRPRCLPTSLHFPELNCRTYVIYGDKPGVFFFSLDAGSRLAVWGARHFFLLPYHYANMNIRREAQGFSYSSRRIRENASFDARYQPEGSVHAASAGTLEHWLTERYCLYTHSQNRVFRGEIHHLPWPLQRASCEIAENTIAAAHGISLPNTAPMLHFVNELDVLIWPLRKAE
jgi:hypothetical protein